MPSKQNFFLVQSWLTKERMLAFEGNNQIKKEEKQKGDHDYAFSEFWERSTEMGKGIGSICITSLDLKFDDIFRRIHRVG